MTEHRDGRARRVGVSFAEDDYARLKAFADERRLSLATAARMLIADQLDARERKQ